jgi:hypothetical protein
MNNFLIIGAQIENAVACSTLINYRKSGYNPKQAALAVPLKDASVKISNLLNSLSSWC